jgi:hypothetical protein
MDRSDPTTDTGMLGSDTENPGPGRDTRRTDPAATAGTDDPEATAAMSESHRWTAEEGRNAVVLRD